MITSLSDPKIHTGLWGRKGNLPQSHQNFLENSYSHDISFCLVGPMHFFFFGLFFFVCFTTVRGETITAVNYFAIEITIVTESQNS